MLEVLKAVELFKLYSVLCFNINMRFRRKGIESLWFKRDVFVCQVDKGSIVVASFVSS